MIQEGYKTIELYPWVITCVISPIWDDTYTVYKGKVHAFYVEVGCFDVVYICHEGFYNTQVFLSYLGVPGFL